jgi:predicted Holliday junction resolvase-like endonuclease
MPSIEYLLFCILVLLLLAAVIAFMHFVIRPLRVYWAIVEAKKMVEHRSVDQSWRSRNVCRTLATARYDLEAVELWKKIRAIREIGENHA